jgi:hypothetical protein
MEVRQWVLFYLSFNCYIASPAEDCRSTITHVPAALAGNEEALFHRTVDTCQTVCNYPGIFEWLQRSVTRRVEACTESLGGKFVHSYKCSLSDIIHKVNVSGFMLI